AKSSLLLLFRFTLPGLYITSRIPPKLIPDLISTSNLTIKLDAASVVRPIVRADLTLATPNAPRIFR
ncbi:hypothetical protein L249_8768, partial [Ophiocordyceps polyrhachis-furcata BCC 54312]